MASPSSIPKSQCHARSISLPPRSSRHFEFDDSKPTTSSSSLSLDQRVDGLRHLYDSLDEMLLLPATGRALAQESQNDLVNELLNELLRLLDVCCNAKDALMMTRDSAQQLQSVLRRRRGDSVGLSHAIQEYQSQRKMVKKAIIKSLRDLKRSATQGPPISIQNNRYTNIVVTLRDVESTTLKVFESLLCFILGSSSQTNTTKWSLVSKLMGPKSKTCDESSERSHVEKVDAELAKKSTSFQLDNVQKELSELEQSLEYLQDGLECNYRHLIKSRVHLLNVLNF